MQWPDPFPPADALAVALILATAWGLGMLIEHPPKARPSVERMMTAYRHAWMREFVTRQPRIFDAAIIDSLRQGTAFFASACLIALGAGGALIADPARLAGATAGLPLPGSVVGSEIKVMLILLFLANALLKFLWAHRLFAYCSVIMAAVPNDIADPAAYPTAAKAAEINITAARGFNRGLRSVYFAVAAMGWLAGPWGLAATTGLAAAVLVRREFFSTSRRVLLEG